MARRHFRRRLAQHRCCPQPPGTNAAVRLASPDLAGTRGLEQLARSHLLSRDSRGLDVAFSSPAGALTLQLIYVLPSHAPRHRVWHAQLSSGWRTDLVRPVLSSCTAHSPGDMLESSYELDPSTSLLLCLLLLLFSSTLAIGVCSQARPFAWTRFADLLLFSRAPCFRSLGRSAVFARAQLHAQFVFLAAVALLCRVLSSSSLLIVCFRPPAAAGGAEVCAIEFLLGLRFRRFHLRGALQIGNCEHAFLPAFTVLNHVVLAQSYSTVVASSLYHSVPKLFIHIQFIPARFINITQIWPREIAFCSSGRAGMIHVHFATLEDK